MNVLQKVRDSLIGAWAGSRIGARGLFLTADAAEEAFMSRGSDSGGSVPLPPPDKIAKVVESAFAELQDYFDDGQKWNELSQDSTWNFRRGTLRRIVALSRVMYLMNPLIRRAVTVQELYVWGRGVQIHSDVEVIDEVVQDFFTARKNQPVIGSSWSERERDQRINGNTFFLFFVNKYNGSARVRILPMEQVEDIVCNPDDHKEPQFYKRCAYFNAEETEKVTESVYYPDIDYEPSVQPKFHRDGTRIEWDAKVLHVKTGGLSSMKFGVPELLSCLTWATSYKDILGNFCTMLAAYARIAMIVSGLQGKKGVAATKSKLNTKLGPGTFRDTNPPMNTGGWALLSGNAEVKPVKTAGSTTGPDEARAIRSMVAAGSDTPEHFFGDSDVGNFATSETLDRPTELKMIQRQQMWVDVIDHICEKLVEWSARAVGGKLRKANYKSSISVDPFDGSKTVIITSPAKEDLKVKVQFPNILERDVTDRVRSVVQAVTLGGSRAEGIIPDRKVVCDLLLEALGREDHKEEADALYPDPVLQGFIDPADVAKDELLAAQGKKELGDAALISAKQPKPNGKAPASKSPAAGAHN